MNGSSHWFIAIISALKTKTNGFSARVNIQVIHKPGSFREKKKTSIHEKKNIKRSKACLLQHHSSFIIAKIPPKVLHRGQLYRTLVLCIAYSKALALNKTWKVFVHFYAKIDSSFVVISTLFILTKQNKWVSLIQKMQEIKLIK